MGNLSCAVDKTVIRHRKDFSARAAPPDDEDISADAVITEAPDSRLVVRTRERYAAVRELHARGLSVSVISRQVTLDRKIVR